MLIVQSGILRVGKREYRCVLGRGGVIPADKKREGDGCTPIGAWPLRACWYRPDRLTAPTTLLPLHTIQPDDGWCDDPAHALYNQHVTPPFPASHETLWREDHAYDLIIPLGYNDNPITPGKGSAIFLHVAQPDYPPTEGCVALSLEDLLALLPELSVESVLEIRG